MSILSNYTGIIPARYQSTRFPGKPLALLGGIPLLTRTYHAAQKAGFERIVIASDDPRIEDLAYSLGAEYCNTDPSITSGTLRCARAVEMLKLTDSPINSYGVINIQGDEPFLNRAQLETVARLLQSGAQIATLCYTITDSAELDNPNAVKVAIGVGGKALYFSRYPIPFLRKQGSETPSNGYEYQRHIGLYGFQTEILAELTKYPPHPLDLAESLEQLTWLANGYAITCAQSTEGGIAIDTPEDLARAEAFLTSLR
jgi:3-deoxy-manno-octulosonate cytidylyltransferase (CMP-KDO synthetase)